MMVTNADAEHPDADGSGGTAGNAGRISSWMADLLTCASSARRHVVRRTDTHKCSDAGDDIGISLFSVHQGRPLEREKILGASECL